MGDARRSRRGRRSGDALRGPAPGPRGHVAAGLRRASCARAPRAPPRAHRGDDGPLDADVAARARDGRRAGRGAARQAEGQLRRVRDHALRPRVVRAGHRARHRARARRHAARQDDRLRRQPHVDAWRLRGPRVRDRHERGRARSRDAVPAAAQAQDARGPRRRGAPAGRRRQGHHPGGHRQDRHGRRDRARHRVPRVGDRGARDGRAHDGLQHVDRGRRARRDDRPRRDDVRVAQGSQVRAARRRVGGRGRAVARRCAPTTAPRSTRRSRSTRPRSGR